MKPMAQFSEGGVSVLGQRFHDLWRRCMVADGIDSSEAVLRLLESAYGEPQRHYHTLGHIEHCLGQFDHVTELAESADALELAIWFHDVIYVAGSPSNERESADLFLEKSDGVLRNSIRRDVESLIMATLHSGVELSEPDQKLMVDIDLSSFGMTWEVFKHDSENVRREMHHQSDAEFYPKQARFQDTLLRQKRFFQSDYFHDRLESQARRNLAEYSSWVKTLLKD